MLNKYIGADGCAVLDDIRIHQELFQRFPIFLGAFFKPSDKPHPEFISGSRYLGGDIFILFSHKEVHERAADINVDRVSHPFSSCVTF
jgi:hypothetical protein